MRLPVAAVKDARGQSMWALGCGFLLGGLAAGSHARTSGREYQQTEDEEKYVPPTDDSCVLSASLRRETSLPARGLHSRSNVVETVGGAGVPKATERRKMRSWFSSLRGATELHELAKACVLPR